MKKYKTIICLIILFIISIFILNTNIKAYDIFTTTHSGIYTEKEVYEEFSKIENFDINKYKNIFCNISNTKTTCYALTDESVNTLSYPSYTVTLTDYNNCVYYYIKLSKTYLHEQSSGYNLCSYNSGSLGSLTSKSKSNFDFVFFTDNSSYNLLDFTPYLSPEEEVQELEITIKASNLLDFLINKTKLIYEILINNQIFKFILGILLSYCAFILIYKIIKNRE